MPIRVDRFALSLPLAAIALSLAGQAQAASFSGARVEAELFDFNVAALNTDTFADTDAFSYAGDQGSVLNVNNADIVFLQDPANLNNFAAGTSDGDGSDYLGSTEGGTEALGQFWVEDEFSFKFDTVLDLAYAVDDPAQEFAEAAGNLELSLYSSTDANSLGSLVDQFSLSGNVSTGGEDFLKAFGGSNFSFAVKDCPANPHGACQIQTADDFSGLVFADLQGAYMREFLEPTYLTLIETKFSGTVVKVPESNMAVALLLGGAAMLWKRKDQATPLEEELT